MAVNDKALRNSTIEVLRIILMLSIICHHSIVHSGIDRINISVISSAGDIWTDMCEVSGKTASALFVLISGFFMYRDEKLNVNRWILLFMQEFFYGCIAGVTACILKPGLCSVIQIPEFVIIDICIGGMVWFISTYLYLYVIHTVINRMLVRMNNTALLLAAVVALSGARLISASEVDLAIYLLTFIGLYCLGAWIARTGIYKKVPCMVSLAIGLSLFMFNALIIGNQDIMVLWNIVPAVFFFAAVLRMKPFYSGAVNAIAASVPGIYMIHDNGFIWEILWHDVFHVNMYSGNEEIFYSIIASAVVFIIALAIDKMRGLIFKGFETFISGGSRQEKIYDSKKPD